MLKNILKLKGAQELSKNELIKVNAGLRKCFGCTSFRNCYPGTLCLNIVNGCGTCSQLP
jgi:hypothetical protein